MAMARVERLNLGLSAGAVAASIAFATPHFALSLAAGAFLEAVNLGAIYRAAQRLFAGQMLTNGWVGMLSLRFILLAIAIYLTMWAGAHPVALLVGLSITMPAVLIDAWLNRPPILDPATLPTFLDEFADEPDENRVAERLWSSGHLLTSQSLDPEDRGDSYKSEEAKSEEAKSADDQSRADERIQ